MWPLNIVCYLIGNTIKGCKVSLGRMEISSSNLVMNHTPPPPHIYTVVFLIVTFYFCLRMEKKKKFAMLLFTYTRIFVKQYEFIDFKILSMLLSNPYKISWNHQIWIEITTILGLSTKDNCCYFLRNMLILTIFTIINNLL